jgi:glycosyltransferase involved in cell wall biosynthesis
MSETVVIGAGPAGPTAAYELSKEGVKSTILEAEAQVGGLSRTNSMARRMSQAGLSVVLASLNRKRLLKLCIRSIAADLANAPFPFEIIVVDGGSSDGSAEWLAQQKGIVTVVQHNSGTWRGMLVARRSWGYFINLGFRIAQGKYVCMLSDDCLVIPGAIPRGYRFFEGALREGRNLGALAFWWREYPIHQDYFVNLLYGRIPTVNHGLYLKGALEKVCYADEDSYRFYHSDSDLILRMVQAGYETAVAPDSYVEHYAHQNKMEGNLREHQEADDRAVFLEKWNPVFDPDQEFGSAPAFFTQQWKSYKDSARTARTLDLCRLAEFLKIRALSRRAWRKLNREIRKFRSTPFGQ